MNTQTKILVIHMKELIIGVIVAIALIILTILAVTCFGSHASTNTSGNSTETKSVGNSKGSGKSSANTYMPGVYTSSISVNGTPMEIQVTVDGNNINAIELKNLSESVTTMYPMMQTSFDELANQVIKNGSTVNVSYEADNKYTSAIFTDVR